MGNISELRGRRGPEQARGGRIDPHDLGAVQRGRYDRRPGTAGRGACSVQEVRPVAARCPRRRESAPATAMRLASAPVGGPVACTLMVRGALADRHFVKVREFRHPRPHCLPHAKGCNTGPLTMTPCRAFRSPSRSCCCRLRHCLQLRNSQSLGSRCRAFRESTVRVSNGPRSLRRPAQGYCFRSGGSGRHWST